MKTSPSLSLPIVTPCDENCASGGTAAAQSSDRGKSTASSTDAERIKERFAQFLREKKYRNTQERYYVLEGVLQCQEHFSADELYLALRTKNVQVSRATVYSTLDLLTRCNILVKHRFQGDSARFELADKMPNHDHLICTECGYIVEFQEEILSEIQNRIAAKNGFKPLNHSLQIFAICQDSSTCEHNRS
ncbi:MAG: transcriptional repressor [Bacteroidota bacterium]|nr:transcriptional repressor [Candidatus Kapabacteria bacterium]MDW8218979.1 transcriptional repressor [Bacteroidota bacterium]